MNPPTRLPAAASRRVRDRLEQAPDGPVSVLHRGPHAIYLDLDGWCVGVVAATGALVPCALRTTSLTGVTGERAQLRSGILHLDDVPVRIGRVVDVAVPRLESVATVVSASSRRPSRRSTSPRSRVEQLVGAGEGLTPYGDDVLCGWLAIHRAAGAPTPLVDDTVRSLLHRTTLLSATLLDCAMHGEVLPQFATWVRRLGTAEEAPAADALYAVGHTSGRGLLEGARRGLVDLGLADLTTGAAA